jgi:hypothetical protein
VAKFIFIVADCVLSLFMLIFGPLAWVVARMRGRARLAHKALELSNVGVVRHHYYEPILFERDLKYSLERERDIVGLDLNKAAQIELLAGLSYADELKAIPKKAAEGQYGYSNRLFEQGDGECYYSMIRHFKPRRIIEIGAGHSTLIAQLAIEKNQLEDSAYQCNHRCVEPYENAWLSKTKVEVIRTPIESLPRDWMNDLSKGDFLFIDSSHVIRPQGDVLHLYLEVLGRLKPGVIIHIHDIFTPRDYPRDWVIDDRRLWDEQYLLESFLCFNKDFQVICALNWLWHNHREDVSRAFPVLATTPQFEPGSFWMARSSD